MLRRTLELAHFFVSSESPDWNFQDFLKKADDISIAQSNLTWKDLIRYSSRQKTEMKLGGFIGSITLEGQLEPFSHLLKMSEVFHVGKATTFGLGKITISSW